ncbi:MAG: cryptochrome/photolyase family protein [Holosporales bacterium]
MPHHALSIYWFDRDMRLADNPALVAAAANSERLLLVHILDTADPRPEGGAAKWWRHGSIAAFQESLTPFGQTLYLFQGEPEAILKQLLTETGATAVYWNRRYEPHTRTRDTAIKAALKAAGIHAESHIGDVLQEPHTVNKADGTPLKVFTPFSKAADALPFHAPAPRIMALPPQPVQKPTTALTLAALGLRPSQPDWAGGLRESWIPGEHAAAQRLKDFIGGALSGYAEKRNLPYYTSTSRLSPYLHFGEITPRIAYQAARATGDSYDVQRFIAELYWREFSIYLLWHFPALPVQNWRASFDAFPWREDAAALKAWQRGQTGYPIVDAGMRELWHTGWMHNRVRMIVASFLVKHLLIPWQRGEEWFWDTLVDADAANNAASWQWVAGCGADAAPYFRIFNPVTQGEKFDPEGRYVKQWCPELKDVSQQFVHQPWEAGALLRPKNYPAPIVDHSLARGRALEAFEKIKKEAV